MFTYAAIMTGSFLGLVFLEASLLGFSLYVHIPNVCLSVS